MRHYVKLFFLTLLLGAFLTGGSNTAFGQHSYGGPTVIVKANEQIAVNPTTGTNLDLSRLSIGQATFVNMKDAKGTPYTFRVRKIEDDRFDIAADPSKLSKLAPNTTVRFVGKNGLVKAVNLTDLSEQRCGVWCIILHVCCVHIHIGPPGNTWEWSCTNCQPGQQ